MTFLQKYIPSKTECVNRTLNFKEAEVQVPSPPNFKKV